MGGSRSRCGGGGGRGLGGWGHCPLSRGCVSGGPRELGASYPQLTRCRRLPLSPPLQEALKNARIFYAVTENDEDDYNYHDEL